MSLNQKRNAGIDSQNINLDRSTASRDEDDGQLMIRVPADEATEEQVKRARKACLARAIALVRRGELEAADRWVGTARELEQKHLDASDSFDRGVVWR